MKTTTKADIVQALHDRATGLTKRDAAELVESIFEILKETLGRGEKVKLSGFGNFVPRDKHARVGRNPQTGEVLTIHERRVLTFRPSEILRGMLNRPAGATRGGQPVR
jgi:integration host factor subunit alpha